jgi:hypothetical protein|tara:strand:+ start:100 stop:357 length:258 start_codon:yes stop_codon:yes gene_type:complete
MRLWLQIKAKLTYAYSSEGLIKVNINESIDALIPDKGNRSNDRLAPDKGKSNFLLWIQVAITEQTVSFRYNSKGSLGLQTPSQHP